MVCSFAFYWHCSKQLAMVSAKSVPFFAYFLTLFCFYFTPLEAKKGNHAEPPEVVSILYLILSCFDLNLENLNHYYSGFLVYSRTSHAFNPVFLVFFSCFSGFCQILPVLWRFRFFQWIVLRQVKEKDLIWKQNIKRENNHTRVSGEDEYGLLFTLRSPNPTPYVFHAKMYLLAFILFIFQD